MKKLVDYCKTVGNKVNEFNGTKEYIATGDVNNTEIVSSQRIDFQSKPSRANITCDIGDILFAKMKYTIKVLLIDETNVNNIYSTGFYILKANENVSNKYLYWYLLSDEFNIQKDSECCGTTQKSLNNNGLKKITIKEIPTLAEQEKIVDELEAVNNVVKYKEAQIEKLDKLVKSRFAEMFGNIKEYVNLQDVVKKDKNSLKRGPFGGSLKKNDFVTNGYLVYEQRHAIHNDFEYEKYYISKEKYEDMKMFAVQPKDLIVSCSGVTLGKISEIPLMAKEGIINQALLKITLNNSIINNIFFMHVFRSKTIQNKLFSFSRGSGIPNFPSMKEVKELQIPLPPIDIQNKFANFVEDIDKLKYDIQKSLEKTKNYKKNLMNRYF